MANDIEKNISQLLNNRHAIKHRKNAAVSAYQSSIAGSIGSFDNVLKKLRHERHSFPTRPTRALTISFTGANDADNWEITSIPSDLATDVKPVRLSLFPDKDIEGVGIRAEFSAMPVIERGNINVHAGRIHAARIFNPPLDAKGLPFIDVHLYSTSAVPVTLYINEQDKIRSDFHLNPGEQIIRVDLRNYRGTRFNPDSWDGLIHDIALDIWPQDIFYPYPNVTDTSITLLGMEANNKSRYTDLVPLPHETLWLTHFRANIPHGADIIRQVGKNYRKLTKGGRHQGKLEGNYTQRGISERFRTFTEHRILSPIFAIVTAEEDALNEKDTSEALQKSIEMYYGITLPINPPGLVPSPDLGNVIMIGPAAAIASGAINHSELDYAGPQGFVISARNGRVIIAGSHPEGTRAGVIRYLEDNDIHMGTRARGRISDNQEALLHELYLVDWPYFSDYPIQCHDGVGNKTESLIQSNRTVPGQDRAKASQIAAMIKHQARIGEKSLPRGLVTAAKDSPPGCFIANKLVWNPFADTSRLLSTRENMLVAD